MGNQYQYDETGQSNFFFLTVLLLLLLPFTYTAIKGGSEKNASRVPYPCSGWNKKAEDVKKTSKSGIAGLSTKHILLGLGWLAFAVVVKRASEVQPDALVYDPFKILGIATSATEKEIKKHYRRMSLKFHPDKITLSENQTAEDANNHYVELTKAYKALTDEDIRHNFEMFGHPDGKQEFSQGIGLPSWVIEKRNVWWVMGAYTLVLGVMLPFFVGRWWYGTRRYTKDGVLNETVSTYFHALKEDTTFPLLLDILSSAEEFISTPSLVKLRKSINKSGIDEYARLVSVIREGPDGKAGWEGYSGWGVGQKRARVLIASHLLRVPIKDLTLLKERHETVVIAITLTTGLFSIALARSWLSIFISIIHLQQFILQAVHPSSSPLLQLPNITPEVVLNAKKIGVENIPQFVKLSDDDLGKLMLDFDGAEKKEAVEVAKNWPLMEFESAKFQIVGEKVVTPAAIVSFTVKLRLKPPGSEPIPSKPLINGEITVNGSGGDTVDVECEESSIDELIGRRSAAEEGVVPTPLAHAPHFPKNRKPTWYILVGDHKLDRIFVPPIKFTDLGPNATRTVRLTFQAPNGPGLYTFQAYVMNDSFVGTDIQKAMRMVVEVPSAGLEPAPEEEDEISDPDEDTLAGQMAIMAGKPVRRIRSDSDGSEDDDTSGTEEDEESDETSDDSD